MVAVPGLNLFHLITTLEVDLSLGEEVERLRVELYRGENAHHYRVHLWRTTTTHSMVGLDEQSDEAELEEKQTLESCDELFEPKDLEIEADNPAEAEAKVLESLKRRVNEAAWAKPNAPWGNPAKSAQEEP